MSGPTRREASSRRRKYSKTFLKLLTNFVHIFQKYFTIFLQSKCNLCLLCLSVLQSAAIESHTLNERIFERDTQLVF